MRKLALSLLLCSALFAQNPNTAVFPGRVATDSDLFVATNLGATTLSAPLAAGATSITLTSAVGFTAPVVVLVDSEIFHCTGLSLLTLNPCVAGSEGTTQAAHNSGAVVKNIMTAWHHNQMAAEVKAVETRVAALGGGGTVTGLTGSGPSWLTWTITNPSTTPAISLAPTTAQTSHQFIGTCGSATTFTPCSPVAGDLPSTTVNAVANDTNIQGAISAQTLTFSWAGTLAAARMANAGVHTGDCITTFPNCTISNSAITLAKMANLAANSILCNNTGSGATPIACTQAQAAAMLAGQTLFTLTTTGTSGAATYSGGTLNIPQYSGGGGNTLTAVTFSATPTFTRTTANQEWSITLTGNVTSSTLSGASAGDILVFNILQDGTGGRTFAWPTGFTEACTVNATLNIGTKQTFYWDGAAAHAISPCVTTVTTSDLMITDGANTAAAAFTLDASAATGANAVKTQVKAGATATVNGALAYDSTNNMLHAAQGAADAFVPQFTAVPANNDCAKWVVSGSQYKLGTAGAACGAGGSTNTTPYFCMGGCAANYGNTLTTVANTMYGWVFNIPGPTTMAKIVFNVGASTNQAWAIYSVNGSSSAKLATSSVGTGCGGCNYALALSYTFTTPGAYYICFSSDGNAQLTVNSSSLGGPGVGSITPIQVFSVASAVTWTAGVPAWPSTTGTLSSQSTGYPYANITY